MKTINTVPCIQNYAFVKSYNLIYLWGNEAALQQITVSTHSGAKNYLINLLAQCENKESRYVLKLLTKHEEPRQVPIFQSSTA
jgi:hypothetical protein